MCQQSNLQTIHVFIFLLDNNNKKQINVLFKQLETRCSKVGFIQPGHWPEATLEQSLNSQISIQAVNNRPVNLNQV